MGWQDLDQSNDRELFRLNKQTLDWDMASKLNPGIEVGSCGSWTLRQLARSAWKWAVVSESKIPRLRTPKCPPLGTYCASTPLQ